MSARLFKVRLTAVDQFDLLADSEDDARAQVRAMIENDEAKVLFMQYNTELSER